MTRSNGSNAGLTRRQYVTSASALVVGGALAGCSTQSSSNSKNNGGNEKTTTVSNEPFSVSIEPMGKVTFEEGVPESWVANNGSWADMGIALGREPPKAVWLPSRYHTQYYDDIPDVSVNTDDMDKLWGDSGVGKEQFYKLNADVHVFDPNFLMNRGKWKQKDIDEIKNNVGPIFGNSIFSRGYPWHEDYKYYTLYEAFEKLARVFQRMERFNQFKELHGNFKSELDKLIPAKEKRPSVGILWPKDLNKPESFSPYLIDKGTGFKSIRELKVTDALAEKGVENYYQNRSTVDYEALLEADPEVLLIRGKEDTSAKKFNDTIVTFMKNHAAASKLTAVKNDAVYRAGPLYEGPITTLVITQRLAKDIYGIEDRLFDRQRVSDIVNGNA